MKVLHCVHYPTFGGPHNQALRLAGPLSGHGVETVVLLPDEPGSARARLTAAGIRVVTIPLGRFRATASVGVHARMLRTFPGEVRAIRRLIRRERVDVVQVAGLVNPHAAIAARLERVPVVWQLIDTRAPWIVAAGAMLFVIPLADVVMSTGRRVATMHPGATALRGRVVPFLPPVDTDRFAPRPDERTAVRAEWGVGEDDLVLGAVANINPMKGIAQLVTMLGHVRAEHPMTRLVLVGAEYETHRDYTELVRLRMSQAGLVEGRDVIFVGARDDVDRQMQGFDLFVLAAEARSEGVPTAILEAMACGLMVISTDVGGVREVVSPETGVMVSTNEPSVLAAAVRVALRDRRRLEDAGAAARRIATERFTLDVAVAAHLRAYRAALRQPS